MTPSPLLVDTDVLIDYLRGHPAAVAFLESVTNPLLVSVITVAELYSGVREGKERQQLDTLLSAFELVPLEMPSRVKGASIGVSTPRAIASGLPMPSLQQRLRDVAHRL